MSVRQGSPWADPAVPIPPADLKKYRRYEVVLTAYNIIGESPASTPVEVFVGEAGELRPDPRPGARRGPAGLRPGPAVRGRLRDPGFV